MANRTTLGIVIAAGIGLWLLSRGKNTRATFQPLRSSRVPATNEEIQEQITQVSGNLQAIAEKYSDPTLLTHAAQATASAKQTLESGISLSEDPGAQTFASQVEEYQAYKDAGGSKNFEEFSLYPLDSAGTKWYNWEISGEFVQEPVGRTGGEVIEPSTYEPPEPEPTPVVKTATAQELNALIESGVSQGSAEYEATVDVAYETAKAEAETTGGEVSWSSEEGYHTISKEELMTTEFIGPF